MHWKFIVVGRPALDYARRGVAEYLPRLQRHVRAEVEYLKDGPAEQVARRLARAAEGCRRVVLDERGDLLTTEQFRSVVDKWELSGTKTVALHIGGADGHSGGVRQSADLVLALGKFTLQHELALVVALEQVYRIYTLKKGEPYHR
ncbi:MAG: 23S rRNA (pseudouridine(1915)-N(3))-methyltransferase RlmH [Verrucomicrobiales bacterium]|nr:23S rRNA (pseudouridine(1915)-N(3))-methyltransferase RlmH [Verrucomicrobiales bacterium]